MDKEKIYVDADDVILNTSEVIIEFLNNIYNINPSKSINDLKDWKYKSIYRDTDMSLVEKYWETDEFFNKVKINKDFLSFYNDTKDIYEWIIFTQGSKTNLQKKKEYFQQYLPNVEMIGIDCSESKNQFDLRDGIQIDDNYKNLLSNAYFKILIKNFHETDYNQVLGNHTNLYIVNEWNEIKDILNFYNKINVEDLI